MPGGYSGPITQHHEYAITGTANKDENFGVGPLGKPDFKHGKKIPRGELKESNRGHGPSRGYHEQPDHGSFD